MIHAATRIGELAGDAFKEERAGLSATMVARSLGGLFGIAAYVAVGVLLGFWAALTLFISCAAVCAFAIWQAEPVPTEGRGRWAKRD